MAPLITHVYTADPSAHVFNGKLYIYPSHDIDSGIPSNDNGDQYDMNDYRVFSIDSLSAIPKTSDDKDITTPPKVTDHGPVLRTQDVPWVSKQLWAPDCNFNASTGEYILYFPARDKDGRFRIGAAVGPSPTGPFTPDPEPIRGSFSIDPACFVDDDTPDKKAYLLFGGIWGGQLQCYHASPDGSQFDPSQLGPHEPHDPSVPALHPKIAILDRSMRQLSSPAQDLVILCPQTGEPIPSTDHDRRFFEAAWMHKHDGTYYFSYSTGDTHFLAYATCDTSPLGPFTYRGKILDPVLGWTTHHSVVEFEGRWWLFYHDCEMSQGTNHLRNVKCREIWYNAEGSIVLDKP